ncbi:adenosylcobinamide-GDP ribazoletransferase [Halosquirtibacter laminarini]|uniref:Adenosylcobinamide-GDP ribazoletransferase n=1 Tax=Halosquirtibacter laminarini TaxID=3374600 RepID=A0AC61NLD0_9BACT|nr:adenosylcobinamide-GDP ribazoletransferase [Prolixibacteraceae bacterium]
MIKTELYRFLTVLSYFTRIPVPNYPYNPTHLSRGTRYFPFVGLIVGTIAALVVAIVTQIGLSHALAILLSMIVSIWVTGAFHEDGFADVCDGFGGGWTKEKILTIMKDSAIGAYGAIGIMLLLALKFLLLRDLNPSTLLPILIMGHTWSRFSSVAIIYTSIYTRMDDSSKSKPLRENRISIKELLIAFSFTLIPCIFVPWQMVLSMTILPFITSWLCRRFFYKWIGGYTGDCLGANQQLVEIAIYLSAVLFQTI